MKQKPLKQWIGWSLQHIWRHLKRGEFRKAMDHVRQVKIWVLQWCRQ